MFGLIKALLFGRVQELDWLQRAKYAARYPYATISRQWLQEAAVTGHDQCFYDERDAFMTTSNERLRSLMNQVHGPRVGGSPSAWQWRVDEASEEHCIQVVLEDALAGSIYESGASEHRVPPGPPYMSGTELKERYCKESMGFAMIWRAQPSLSGFHYWTLQHVEGSSPPPTSSSLPSPPLSDSVHAESQFDCDPNTPASSVPSPYQEKFSPVIKGDDEPLQECDPEKTLKAKIVVPRGRLKDILYGEKESLFGFKPARLQSSSSRPSSRDRTEGRPLSQRALLLAVQETSPHPKARGRTNTASSALSDATSCATSTSSFSAYSPPSEFASNAETAKSPSARCRWFRKLFYPWNVTDERQTGFRGLPVGIATLLGLVDQFATDAINVTSNNSTIAYATTTAA